MKVKINIPWLLRGTTGETAVVVAEGNTVGAALNDLANQYPALKEELFDKQGNLLPFVGIDFNEKRLRPEELDKPLSQGDELAIIIIVGGG